jgi:hypothetical protein
MTCKNIQGRFVDYLTHELSKKEREEIQAHVAECDHCRRELEYLTQVWTELGVLKEERPSPQLRTRFYTLLDQYKKLDQKKEVINRAFFPVSRICGPLSRLFSSL